MEHHSRDDQDQPDQDQPDLDRFAERLGTTPEAETADDVSSSSNPRTMLVGRARSLIGVVQDVVAPVVDRAQAKVRQTIDDRRSMVDRVEQLESQVAALTERLDAR